MDIGGYDFSGVFTNGDQIPAHNIGVYVVLCLIDDHPHCVLYVGTSEGGTGRATGADVTETGNLQHTLRYHDKRDCWQEETHGEVGYCVKPVTDTDRRLEIRDELQWKYVTPCGTDSWDTASQTDEAEFKHQFGARGSESV
ncbi:hypothetical protein [Haloplanus rubicundus]|uniref:hypothetical protein n=1 Tax=Haloplanus rubicundus TaxID=1547898 RepID=UPI0013009F60|nr:hypothetical protein [Haloplanus rubicundus]